MQTATQLENIVLHFQKGATDKIFQCAIEPAGDRFVVNFAYGRAGTTLNTGTKTNVPVGYEAAKRIFTQAIKDMNTRGYRQLGPEVVHFTSTQNQLT